VGGVALCRGRPRRGNTDRGQRQRQPGAPHAASLSELGVPVDLADAVTGLDRHNLALVLAALSHANGSHEHKDYATERPADGPVVITAATPMLDYLSWHTILVRGRRRAARAPRGVAVCNISLPGRVAKAPPASAGECTLLARTNEGHWRRTSRRL